MKHIISIIKYILLFLLLSANLYAQMPRKKTIQVKTWHISDPLAVADTIPVDTLHLNYFRDNLRDRFSIANSYNGNIISPIQSKLYFDRPNTPDFLFSEAYFPYVETIEDVTFYNTKTPFSNITYLTGGSNFRKQEQIKFLFTANANKHVNFGTTIDYVHAWGEYQNQEAKRFKGSLFGSFDGRRYKASGAAIINNLSNYENGGIEDISYITNPIEGYATKDFPVNLDGYSNYRNSTIFYNHQYAVGFEREIKVSEDSTYLEYIPITRFIHTLKLNQEKKRYYESSVDTIFYSNTYMPELGYTNDTSAVQTVSNTFAIHMEEEFNKWMKFGLTGYIQNEIQRFTYNVDSLVNHSTFSNTKVGGVLSKQQGGVFRYKAQAELGLQGYKAGNFLLQGNAGGYFKLWKDSVSLVANGFIRNDEPSYFLQKYNSNHFRWTNDFSPINRTKIGGTFAIPTRSFSLNVSIENILNYVYFNSSALPEQYSGGVQIISANLKQNFKFGRFGLENNVVYQVSSNQDVIPLPMLALYHNLYYHDIWFKVLGIQAGVDMRYHSSYFAPILMPATGQFYVQNHTKVGNFPVMSAYLNFHLKQTRFFFEYFHLNQQFTKGVAYLSMPGYPIDPAIVKMGVSVNFYN